MVEEKKKQKKLLEEKKKENLLEKKKNKERLTSWVVSSLDLSDTTASQNFSKSRSENTMSF